MKNKIVHLLFILLLSAILGYGYQRYQTAHKVAIRVGASQQRVDYDLMCAINFISYQFEKNGYSVIGTSYNGHLYPPSLDDAGVNLFVRGFEPFYDIRALPNKKNIYYIQRFTYLYAEEFTGYDDYLSSQQKIKQHMPEYHTKFTGVGAVPHQLLQPDYQYDVLYIYEFFNKDYAAFLNSYIPNTKIYSGSRFANFTVAEREQELAKARLVVYEMTAAEEDDEDYVPFAVYDIMSYGRPCLTNFKEPLSQKYNGLVALFDNTTDDLIKQTILTLQQLSHVLERKAQQARDILQTEPRHTF